MIQEAIDGKGTVMRVRYGVAYGGVEGKGWGGHVRKLKEWRMMVFPMGQEGKSKERKR